MRNQLVTYFLPDDESALSHGLRSLSPTIFFVDHDEARAGNATLYSSLIACGSGFAYIWDAETNDVTAAMAKWIELVRLKNGDGALVQFLRSRFTAEERVNGEAVDLLLSGRVAMMGSGTEKQKGLKKLVYKAVSRISTADVFPVSPTNRERLGAKQLGSRVGYCAVEWCNDPSHLLRNVSTKVLYGLPAAQKTK